MKTLVRTLMDTPRYLKPYARSIAALLGSYTLITVTAQVTTEVQWQRCLGGSDTDYGSMLQQTNDGGFVCVGYGESVDGDLLGAHISGDMLVSRFNADGSIQWSRTIGGSMNEFSTTCLEASDGSIMVLGATFSTDGDATGTNGSADVWLIALSASGEIIWQNTYGGSSNDNCSEWVDNGGRLIEMPDGGFVIHAETGSNDGDVLGFHQGSNTSDVWVLKVSSTGALEWSRALGGTGGENLPRAIRTMDGGTACVIFTLSNDGDVLNGHGGGDCWLVKLSASGTIEWSRTIGGSGLDIGEGVRELPNGDLVVFGRTGSSDGDITQNNGGRDMLLAKVSASGSLLWERTFGGSLDDACTSMLLTPDNGFILCGTSGSSNGDVSSNQGGLDVWLVKADANGDLVWQRSFGGTLVESAVVFDYDEDGYLLSGATSSDDGDIQGNHGNVDQWLAKVSWNGQLLWQRCLGGSNEEFTIQTVTTADSCYVTFGDTGSNDGDVAGNHGGREIWVVKLRVTEPPEPVEPLECALFVPNAFSPDNSTTNDAQCIYGTDCVTSMTFKVFDRWGNKVFESTDPKACWDGTNNGQALDPAVFVYHLNATLADAQVVEKQGNITLVR